MRKVDDSTTALRCRKCRRVANRVARDTHVITRRRVDGELDCLRGQLLIDGDGTLITVLECTDEPLIFG